MRIVRGRARTPQADRERTARLLETAAELGESGVRVWTPHRQIAFGRRDARCETFDRARRIAHSTGFPPVERRVGGRAVAYTGETVAFAVSIPIEDIRSGLTTRYEVVTGAVLEALGGVGADVERGEPPRSYCPGSHSLRAVDGGKLVGIAQRVQQDAALVAGCLTVTRTDAKAVRDVLEPIYAVLDVPFDPDAVGSIAAAGGPSDVERVQRVMESALATGPWADGSVTIDRIGATETERK